MFHWKTVRMHYLNSSSPATCVPGTDEPGRLPRNTSYRIGPDDLLLNLVFFSTFEELKLPIRHRLSDDQRAYGLVWRTRG
jgi:hypothetical protein